MERWQAAYGRNLRNEIEIHAAMGDRQRANELAAEDPHQISGQGLVNAANAARAGTNQLTGTVVVVNQTSDTVSIIDTQSLQLVKTLKSPTVFSSSLVMQLGDKPVCKYNHRLE